MSINTPHHEVTSFWINSSYRIFTFWLDYFNQYSDEANIQVGKGVIFTFPLGTDLVGGADKLAEIAHNLSKFISTADDVPMIDDAADGITATLFKERILYLNPTDNEVKKTIRLRESDFPFNGRTGRPEKWTYTIKMMPHSIESIFLK